MYGWRSFLFYPLEEKENKKLLALILAALTLLSFISCNVETPPDNNDNNSSQNQTDTDGIIVNNEYVTVIVTGYENDDIWKYTVKLTP